MRYFKKTKGFAGHSNKLPVGTLAAFDGTCCWCYLPNGESLICKETDPSRWNEMNPHDFIVCLIKDGHL